MRVITSTCFFFFFFFFWYGRSGQVRAVDWRCTRQAWPSWPEAPAASFLRTAWTRWSISRRRALTVRQVGAGQPLLRQAPPICSRVPRLERWPGRLEVFPLQNLADQRLLVRIEDRRALRSPAAQPTQAFNGPGLPVARDQAIEGCPADPEFPGDTFDHTDPQTLRIAVQQVADRRLPAAGLIPTRLICRQSRPSTATNLAATCRGDILTLRAGRQSNSYF